MKRHGEDFIFGENTLWHDAGNGAERQILGYNDEIMMVKVKFRKGEFGSSHSHPHSQVTYVASGVFEFSVNGRTETVRTGDGISIQPDTEHSCVCLEDGLLIDCFTPMRDTFIPE